VKSILVAQDLDILTRLAPSPGERVVLLSAEPTDDARAVPFADLFPPAFFEEHDAAADRLTEDLARSGPLDWPTLDGGVVGWWFFDHRVRWAVGRCVLAHAQARRVLEATGARDVRVAARDSATRDAYRAAFARANVRVEVVPVTGHTPTPTRRRIPGAVRVEETLRRVAARLRGLPAARGQRRPLLFVTFSGYWRERDALEPDVGTLTDVYVGELIDEAESLPDLRPFSVAVRRSRGPMTIRGGLRHFRRLLSGTLPYVPLEVFDGPDVRDAFARAASWVIDRKREIGETARHPPLVSDGTDLWPEVRPDFLRALDDVPPYLRRVVKFRKMLRRFRPAAVVQYGEAAPSGRALCAACVAEDVPSAAIQHGIGLDYGYRQGRLGVRGRGYGDAHGCPVPDVTFVYGETWGDRLVEAGGYPRAAVAAVGFHRLDRLFTLRRPPDRPVHRVLFVSSPISEAERTLVVRGLVALAGARPELRIEIKPHPLDADLGARFDVPGFADRIVVTAADAPIRPLLANCDLVVAKHSTVILEAAACGKPIVGVNFSGRADAFPFAERGIVRGVETPGGLPTALLELVDDPDARAARVRAADEGLRTLLARTGGATGEIIRRIAELAGSAPTRDR
jgi:hypothetical protein